MSQLLSIECSNERSDAQEMRYNENKNLEEDVPPFMNSVLVFHFKRAEQQYNMKITYLLCNKYMIFLKQEMMLIRIR